MKKFEKHDHSSMKKGWMIALVLCCYLSSLSLMEGVQESKVAVGKWGKKTGGPQNGWSFELQKDDRLVSITIDHGDVIYSLIFTGASGGILHPSKKAGGWAGGDTISEVNFTGDEKLIGINGTVGTKNGYTVIKSLSFQTNNRVLGPFGGGTENAFSLPWDKGCLVGFYGLAVYYIDAIGVYLKATSEELIKVGTWGKTQPTGPQNVWSFQLEKNHCLGKITIDHGDLIYSLMFTTQNGISTYTTKKFGGSNGGGRVSEAIFEVDEQITSISGTVALSRGSAAGLTVISSLTFVTNKKTHGPFGTVRGTPFTVPWGVGTFAGFYGLGGYYIDRIGVYLRPLASL